MPVVVTELDLYITNIQVGRISISELPPSRWNQLHRSRNLENRTIVLPATSIIVAPAANIGFLVYLVRASPDIVFVCGMWDVMSLCIVN